MNQKTRPKVELMHLLDQVEMMEDEDNPFEGSLFYDTLKTIISLRLENKDYSNRLEVISNQIIDMAKLDFTKQLEVGESDDIFAYISVGLNLLNQELKFKAVSRDYLKALDIIPEMIIITNHNNDIEFMNQAVNSRLGIVRKEFAEQNISELFTTPTFKTLSNDGIYEHEVILRDSSGHPFLVNYKITILETKKELKNGRMYTFKEKFPTNKRNHANS